MRFAFLLILLAGCATEPPRPVTRQLPPDARDWTLANGEEFVAVPISADSKWVNVRTVEEDAQVVSIPLDSLSEQDREWVEEQLSSDDTPLSR